MVAPRSGVGIAIARFRPERLGESAGQTHALRLGHRQGVAGNSAGERAGGIRRPQRRISGHGKRRKRPGAHHAHQSGHRRIARRGNRPAGSNGGRATCAGHGRARQSAERPSVDIRGRRDRANGPGESRRNKRKTCPCPDGLPCPRLLANSSEAGTHRSGTQRAETGWLPARSRRPASQSRPKMKPVISRSSPAKTATSSSPCGCWNRTSSPARR